jgi:hypothetical protein
MSDDPSDEVKLQLLWIDYHDRKRAAQVAADRAATAQDARPSGFRAVMDAIDAKILIVLAAAAVGVGQGPEIAGRFFTIIEFIFGVHK